MASGLNKTKRRIVSVKSTKKITKAMEMVATVKLKRYRDLSESALEYLASIEAVLAELFYYDQPTKSHYGQENESAPGNLYIVIGSDLGLCAGYNNDIFRHVEDLLQPGDCLAPIGEKARNHYLRKSFEGVSVREDFYEFGLDPDVRSVQTLCQRIRDDFNQCKYKKVIIIYTQYVNSLRFVPQPYTLLPVSLPYEVSPEDEYEPTLFEESPRAMIHRLLGTYLGAVISAKLAESQRSEQAARRNAMDAANDNCDNLLNDLTIEYNKARQGAITQEITEVVSGARAQQ